MSLLINRLKLFEEIFMSGTYLVCDLCGNFGPPAGFVMKDGLRMCYQCCYHEGQEEAPAPPGVANKRDEEPALAPPEE